MSINSSPLNLLYKLICFEPSRCTADSRNKLWLRLNFIPSHSSSWSKYRKWINLQAQSQRIWSQSRPDFVTNWAFWWMNGKSWTMYIEVLQFSYSREYEFYFSIFISQWRKFSLCLVLYNRHSTDVNTSESAILHTHTYTHSPFNMGVNTCESAHTSAHTPAHIPQFNLQCILLTRPHFFQSWSQEEKKQI